MRIMARLIPVLLLVSQALLLRAADAVPPPESVFGFKPGADNKLATYDQSIAYFKKLAASSKYIKLMEAGKTTQGRTVYFALISNPKNLAKIDRYREIAQRLAHPQGLTDERGAQARARRQGLRPPRRRLSRDRGGRGADDAAARLRPDQPRRTIRRSRDPRQRRRPAVADDEPGRPADGGGVAR